MITHRQARRSRFEAWPLFLLLVAVVGWSAWRAAHQSLTHDEAWTWTNFAAGGPSVIFGRYAPNNHVLHSLLVWAAEKLFGPHELALRVPALLGATLFLLGLVRLARRLLGEGWPALFFFGALALNPLFLDYFVEARGYSLMLAGLAWGAWLLHASVSGEGFSRRAAAGGSALLGLALAAVPSCAFAVVGVGGATLVHALRRGEKPRAALAILVLPGLTIAGTVLGLPLLHATPAQFHFGAESPWATAVGIVDATLAHLRPPYRSRPDGLARFIPIAAGILLALGVLAGISGLRDLLRKSPRRFFASALGLQILAVCAGVLFFHLPWPQERTALDLMFLGALAVGEAVGTSGRPRVRTLATWGMAILVVVSAFQLEGHRFRSHPYDAASRQVYEAVVKQARGMERRPVSVWAEARLARALEAYRQLRGDEDLLGRIVLGWKAPDRPFDLYVLTAERAKALEKASPLGALAHLFREVGRFDGGRVLVVRPR